VADLKHLYSEPNERTSHKRSTPTLGGMAIFAGFLLSISLFVNVNKMPELQYITAAALIIFFIGLKDDILVISPTVKMMGQILAASILVIFGNIRFTNFHGFFGIFEISYFVSILFTVFFFIVIINGYNLIDGIDGLSSGIGIVTAATFGVWFYLVGNQQYALVATALIGGLAAFFRFNVFGVRNKIFMGDTGSLLIGLIISILTIRFNELNIKPDFHYGITSAPSVSFGVLIIPIFDTMRVMFIRLIINRSPFKADKNHIHHRLLKLGCSHLKATIVLVLINLVFIAFSFTFQFISIRRLLLIIVLLGMLYSSIPSYLLEIKNKSTKKEMIAKKQKFAQKN